MRTAVVVLAAGLAAGGCGAQKPAASVASPPAAAELGRPIGPQAHPVVPAAARFAARRFLHGYLAAVYGRGDIDAIPATTRQLRALLRRQSGRVPPAQRTRHPRVAALALTPAAADRLRGQATVDDGDLAPYPLAFTIARDQTGRWRVTSVGD